MTHFLKRGVILPILKAFGILPADTHKLIRWLNGFPMLHAVSFKHPGGRLSISDAFLLFNFLRLWNYHEIMEYGIMELVTANGVF